MNRRPLQIRPSESFALDGESTTFDPKTRTMRVQWLSQQDHIRMDFWGERFLMRLYPEGCDLSRVNAGGPFTFLHSVSGQATIIGNIVEGSASLSPECVGFADVRFIDFADDESDTADDKRAAMKVAKKYLRPISMDAILDETSVEEFPDDSGQMPIVHVRKWSVAALSAVPIQQDPGALTMEAQMSTQHAPETPKAPAPVVEPDPIALANAQAAGESAAFERLAECQEIGLVFGIDAKAVLAMAKGKEPIADVRKRLIAEKAKAGDALGITGHVQMGVDEQDVVREAIIEAFESRIGNKAPSEKARRFAGRRFDFVAREYLRSTSRFGNVDAMSDRDCVNRAVGFGASGQLAPSDLPVFLVEGAQRVLVRMAAEATPMNFEPLCRVQLVDDFRQVKLVRRLFAGTLKEIATNGNVEYPFVLDEDFETAKAKAWGGGIMLGREALQNNDLGVLEDMPAEILRVTREHQTDRFWSQFLTGVLRDTKKVCHADHSNVVASGGAGPGTLAQLSAMRKLFKAAKDGEQKLRLRMTHLIVPESLYDEAAQIVSGQIVAAQASNSIPSDYRGLGIISDTSLDTDSAKKWYAAAAAVPCFAWVRLRGQEIPVIQQERDFDSRGLKIAGFFDYNIAPCAYQGIAYNKGEA